MKVVTITQAKAQLSRLQKEVAPGQEIIVSERGRPVARLVALDLKPGPPRVFGRMKGRIWIADDFDAPLPDHVLAAFEGEE